MAKGISLHIGLDYVDPNHYSGWNGILNAAEYDANDMYEITKSQGFHSVKLLRNEATRNAVISEIKKAATTLTTNDLFIISYSGHGGQLPDTNGDENDSQDETWCLFDGELVDDELYQLWSTFQKNVRLLIISDSCHSGTVTKAVGDNIYKPEIDFSTKFMPRDIEAKTYFNNKEFYDNILENVKNFDSQNIQANVKLISACQDNQVSTDGTFNGIFTEALKKVWNGGKFNGNYNSFYEKIKDQLHPSQTPNYYNIGQQNQSFDNQKPFSI